MKMRCWVRGTYVLSQVYPFLFILFCYGFACMCVRLFVCLLLCLVLVLFSILLKEIESPECKGFNLTFYLLLSISELISIQTNLKTQNYSLPFKCHFYFIYSTILKWRPEILVNIRNIFFHYWPKPWSSLQNITHIWTFSLTSTTKLLREVMTWRSLVFVSLTSFPGTSTLTLFAKKKKMIIGLIHRKIFI